MLNICSCFDSCIAHVEHAGQDHAATEVGEVEEVNQEEEQQQFVGADQGQEPESEQDLTNFYNTQGKPRFIWKPNVTTISLSLTITTILMH